MADESRGFHVNPYLLSAIVALISTLGGWAISAGTGLAEIEGLKVAAAKAAVMADKVQQLEVIVPRVERDMAEVKSDVKELRQDIKEILREVRK